MKTTPVKASTKIQERFLGLLNDDEIARGKAGFIAEVTSKEVRLKATKIKKNTYQHSF